MSNSKHLTVDIETGDFLDSLREAILDDQLSKEEKERLDQLIADRLLQEKHLKLEAFKELPAHLRQQIIDDITIATNLERINRISGEKTNEEKMLSAKQDRHFMRKRMLKKRDDYPIPIFGVDVKWTLHFGNELNVTLEDLMTAHTDATIDEEVLKP